MADDGDCHKTVPSLGGASPLTPIVHLHRSWLTLWYLYLYGEEWND